MNYPEDELERLDYNEQQQSYHRAQVTDSQPEGWQTAYPTLIDKFRFTHVNLRGAFTDVQQAFIEFAGPFVMPDA